MRRLVSLLLVCALAAALKIHAGEAGEKVFVIPVETEIDMQAFHYLRSGLREATDKGAGLVVVKLNTYGGALDAADSMRTILVREKLPTVAFVDHNAASAGALIALACDSVFMSPGASMGAATVVNGSGEPMPEKYQSYMSAIMRATAEHHGRELRVSAEGDSVGQEVWVWRRDPSIAASMVNPEKAISFTTAQAIEAGYADGSATSVQEVAESLGISNPEISYYQPNMSDTLLGFLANAAVRAILVTLILGGIFMEMHTPGMGFAAAVSLVATVLYFLPMIVTGTMPAWIIILFVIGVVLVALEIFVIPGFGLAGTGGGAAIIVALCGALMANDSITGFDMTGVLNALMTVGAGIILTIILVLYLTSSRGPKVFRRHAELMTELSNDKGFVGVDMSVSRYVGSRGESVTVLRPAGKIRIDDHVFDAVSTGEFIPANRPVKAVRYENAQLYVIEEKAGEERQG